MAAIDKIYGSYEEWCQLFYWIVRSPRPQYARIFYPTPTIDTIGPILSAPVYADRWLWDNCPFKFVKKRLKVMYNGKRP